MQTKIPPSMIDPVPPEPPASEWLAAAHAANERAAEEWRRRHPPGYAPKALAMLSIIVLTFCDTAMLTFLVRPTFVDHVVTSSRVSGDQSEMRTLATSLAFYAFGTGGVQAPNLNALTTPVGYLSQLPQSRFGASFRHGTDGVEWIVISPGPDLDFDIEDPAAWLGKDPATLDGLIDLTYDPTNGTRSSGDIWRRSF